RFLTTSAHDDLQQSPPNREEKGSECRVDSTTSEAPLTQGSFPRCLLRCCGSETHLFGRTASLGRVRMYRSHRRCVGRHSDRVGLRKCLVSPQASNCPRTAPK